jgi:hypothetical protein
MKQRRIKEGRKKGRDDIIKHYERRVKVKGENQGNKEGGVEIKAGGRNEGSNK